MSSTLGVGPTAAPSGGGAGLHARLSVSRGDYSLNVAFTASPGEVIAVVGPNGSGKSTLLRVLAGITASSAGEVRWGAEVWEGPGVRLDMSRRGVGMVFADVLLLPHLTALDNVAYGPRCRGASRSAARRTAAGWLDRFGVGELAHRMPTGLSGGQAQRVAIARALATDPRLLLLDEPLAALDVGIAQLLRAELATHLRDFAGVGILVTHDAIDALSLADRILVLDEGRIVQEGPAADVAGQPVSSHVARLVGLNVLAGEATAGRVRLIDGSEVATVSDLSGPVQLTFAPAAVTLSRHPPSGSARNRWSGTVVGVTPNGRSARVQLDVAGGLLADVTMASVTELDLRPGRHVWATAKATEMTVRPAAPGRSPGALDPRLR